MPDKSTRPQALNATLFGAAEYQRQHFFVRIPHGTKKETLMHPDYWAHVADQVMSVHSLIEVVAEDNSFWGILLVVDRDKNWLRVKDVQWAWLHEDVGEDDLAQLKDFTVKWRGAAKYAIIRNSDRAVITDGIADKREAYAQAVQLQKRLAA